uniref:Phosphatidylinositol-glycan biosynthesis class F protein n=1 Tax=Bracon brevicornis TaxID=1563983 RepID=A0A6V7MGD9_9HYME
MFTERVPGSRQLLFYTSFTCIYFPLILLLLKLNETVYYVGKFRFIPIFLILLLAEGIKWAFSRFTKDPNYFAKLDNRVPRSKRNWGRGCREFVKFITLTMISLSIYYVLLVLFGAPLSTHREETSMLAMTLTFLTVVAPGIHLGADVTVGVLARLQSANNNSLMTEAMSMNIKGTLLGAWLGAIFLPLDWDRPWQAWPIPCIIGAFVGYMIAHFITLVKMLPIISALRSTKIHR